MYESSDDITLHYPVGVGFRTKPLSTVNINIGTNEYPVYQECRTYPAFPWGLADMTMQGDGKESVFTPVKDTPDDHSAHDPKKHWDLLTALNQVPEETRAKPIPGKMDYENR